MNIIEKLTKRIQDRQVEAEDTNAALWQEYRDLILHEGELPEVELERLAGLMQELGIENPGEVEFHKKVLTKFETAKERHETEAPKMLAESQRLEREAKVVLAKISELTTKLARLRNESELAAGQWHQATAQAEQCANLRALFGGLIGGPSLPVALNDYIGIDAELVELRQRLGLEPIQSKLGRELQPGRVSASMSPITLEKR